jgi:hypothetical protein
MIIDFTPAGTAQAMHRDGFDLAFLGERSIKRASDIKFNEGTQLWDIWLIREEEQPCLVSEAKGFPAYDVARSFEVAWLDACRLKGLDSVSVEGREVLGTLRYGALF